MAEGNRVSDHDALPFIPGVVSQLYEYKGFWGCDGVCGLQQGRNHKTGKDFVILTELPSNEGTSVTNMVEELATQVLQRLGLDPSTTIIIEHYPERGDHGDLISETWDLVIPDWEKGIAKSPQGRHMWQHITRAEAFAMMGLEEGRNDGPDDYEDNLRHVKVR